MATKKKHTTDAEPAANEVATADTDPAPDAPVAADVQPPSDAQSEPDAFIERMRAHGEISEVAFDLGSVTVDDAPQAVEDPQSATERRAAVQLLQDAIAAVYGQEVAANYVAARRDDLASITVAEIMDAAANVPPATSAEAEHILGAVSTEPGAPTVAGNLPSGDPDMLPPVEVRSALRPPALQVTVPEQGFEVRPRSDAPSYYRVMAARNLMVDGLMASFASGQVIDDRSYDLAWLRKNGVELVPCEAPEPYSSNF